MMIAKTPEPPYYAVIFTSVRTPGDKGYSRMSEAMINAVQQRPGFLGFESARTDIGITVSYWKDIDSIKKWKNHEEHKLAMEKGKSTWYSTYKIRICKVEGDYEWKAD
jgi:heme-degrading monooxygenase HmoA